MSAKTTKIKGVLAIYKVYVADYTDCPDIIVSQTDYDALGEALNREKDYGLLLGLSEICGDGLRVVI